MARDKSKDDKMFHCGQDHEHNYVVGLYDKSKQPSVSKFLNESCDSKLIKNSTHKEVYELIEKRLGYAVPV